MPLAVDKLRNQPKKLRKALRKFPQDPSPDRVHQLRTRTRRMEAMVRALALDSRKNERRLLKALKPVRKQAGKVRDLDVLTGFASQIHPDGEEECSVQLLEHLGGQRERRSRKAKKTAAAHAPEIKRRLKRSGKLVNQALISGKRPDGTRWPAEAAAVALQLEGELRDWPKLGRRNLHEFRLKVKELRYVLQMAADSKHAFVSDLGEVQDAIGEWHDWDVLAGIANSVIQHPGCNLLKAIRSTAEDKFHHGLDLANKLRQQHLGVRDDHRKRKSGAKSSPANQSALTSASSLAA